jgi:multidrug efflux system membrane fusion protein
MNERRYTRPADLLSVCATVAALILAILTVEACSGSAAGAARRARGGAAVPAVWVAARQRDVPVEVEAIGNVEAYSTVSIKPQLTGQLMQTHFHEGDFVKANDLLFTIDPRPLAAQLEQAQANSARDTAQLKQAEANLLRDAAQQEYTQSEVVRYGRLLERGLISKEQFDQMKATADAAAALVNADRAAVSSAKAQEASGRAAIDNAKLQLEYTEIRSPINGRTGTIEVKNGNILTAATTELMTVTQVQPIYVTFAVPAVHLSNIKRYMAGTGITVTATSQDKDATRSTGHLTFVDNAVDPSTDTIKLKATFANEDRRLWPGQFIRVVMRLTTTPNATVVPVEAIQTGQDGQFVFLVRSDSTVEQRAVTTGSRLDQEIVVATGLKPGESVVTEGQLRLEAGSRVVPARAGGRGQGRSGQAQSGGAAPSPGGPGQTSGQRRAGE